MNEDSFEEMKQDVYADMVKRMGVPPEFLNCEQSASGTLIKEFHENIDRTRREVIAEVFSYKGYNDIPKAII